MIGDRQSPFVVMINLTGHGTLQYLYPDSGYGDPAMVMPLTKQPLPLDQIEVKPPFGADHLLVLSSDHDPVQLKQALLSYHDSRLDRQIADRLLQAMASGRFEVGFRGLFTRPRSKSECQ